MTDAEVKKALECCGKHILCIHCPLYEMQLKEGLACCDKLNLIALDLINRQEVRIHQQEKIIMEIQNANLIDLKATIGNYKAENESLKEKNSNLTSDLTSLQNDLISAKAEIEQYKIDKKEYIKDYEELENNLKCAEEEQKFEHQRVINLQAEVERLQNAYKQCAWERDIFAEDMTQEIKKDCSYLMLDIKTIKAEAYKEFAEEYKDQIKNYTGIFTDDDFYVSLQAVLSTVDFIKEKLVGDA